MTQPAAPTETVREKFCRSPPSIIITNTNTNTNANFNRVTAGSHGREKNKWVSLLLCLFLGVFGAHKFYENKIGMGVLYLFALGLFSIGALIDCFVILFKPIKPNPYYV